MVYRVFQIFNELDLLEIKLETEDSFVDQFIIIESEITHSGNPKPLYLQNCIERYSRQWEKLRIVTSKESDKAIYPHLITRYEDKAWQNESFQRNYSKVILEGQVKDTDIVILSDCDEILDEKTFKEAKELLDKGCRVVKVNQPLYIYKFNYFHTNASSMRVMTGKFWNEIIPTNILRARHDAEIFGGWHFSFLYKKDEDILLKFKSFGHAFEKTWLHDPKTAREHLLSELKTKRVELDDSFPPYLLENKEKFKEYID